MLVYLDGDATKGVVASHTIVCNPGAHLGVENVPPSWTETDADGRVVGKTFHVPFVDGVADTMLGEYLVGHGLARRERWRPPAGSPAAGEDPAWRWREGA